MLEWIAIGATLLVALYGMYVVKFMPRKMGNYTLFDEDFDAIRKIDYPKYKISGHCLVTGGSGFLGTNLVNCLVKQGLKVSVLDLVVPKPGKGNPKATYIQGDLTKKDSVIAALKGVDCVFHCATAHPNSQNYKLLHAVNVTGTENVIDACLANGVKTLVYTSSASVVFDGTDQKMADESAPYPRTFRDPYCKTKALAEKAVMKAGRENKGTLNTVSLRPHGLFGPHDQLLVPTTVEVARAGKNRIIIGDGKNIVDWTYIGNVVHSHMLAAQAAQAGDHASGKTYFITNDEPMPFWDFMSILFVGLGFDAPTKRLPYGLILNMARVFSMCSALVSPIVKIKSNFTPNRIQIAATYHCYSIEAAKRDLDYKPIWNMNQGLHLTLRSFEHLYNPDKPRPQHEYKADEVAEHNKRTDLWVIIKGKVYDLTSYVDSHPGKDAILNHAGGDATAGFYGDQHPPTVYDTVHRYCIGTLKK